MSVPSPPLTTTGGRGLQAGSTPLQRSNPPVADMQSGVQRWVDVGWMQIAPQAPERRDRQCTTLIRGLPLLVSANPAPPDKLRCEHECGGRGAPRGQGLVSRSW